MGIGQDGRGQIRWGSCMNSFEVLMSYCQRVVRSAVKRAAPAARHPRARVRTTLLATAVLAAFCVGRIAVSSVAGAAAAAPAYTWPQFHNSPSLTGESNDPGISSTNASTLGVKWMTPLGSALDSPMVAYNDTLKEALVYAGSNGGFFDALDANNGKIVWSDNLGDPITSSALVENGNVWIAPAGSDKIYKLNAATGATECSASIAGTVLSTPDIATPPGGVLSVYFGAIGQGSTNGPVAGYAESNCAPEWSWSSYVISGQNSGTWSELSYAVDADGVGLLVFGSANPDSEVYALNAVTGALVWNYATYCPASEDWDVGAGSDISAPGVNGFADGVVYVDGKDGIFYALNLTTGKVVWRYNFGGNRSGNPTITDTDAITVPALTGTTLVFGDTRGLYALNAVTGKKLWFETGTGDINSSPTIVGPAGGQVVAYADNKGHFHVVDLATGASLYSYVTSTTNGYNTSSPADYDGNLLIAAGNGFLYDFDPDGANSPSPDTAVTAPSAGASLVNPNGDITVSGTASASDGVAAVMVEVQMDGAAGPWFSQKGLKFQSGLAVAYAKVADKDATSTTWSLAVPVPAQAATYQVLASAVGENGLADDTCFSSSANADSVSFSVQASSSAPVVSISPSRIPPGGEVSVTSEGFAPDETVTFTATTSTGSTVTLATVSADSSGATPPTNVTIPTTLPFGADGITGTGKTSGDVGTGSVYVANNSPQFGYGPLHQGAEPNDKVIAKTVGRKAVQVWSFTGGGAFDTTPAIDQGIVYFGDEAGDFYAAEETSGDQVFKVTDGSAINSSPAVDSGSVFYGDNGGDVNALDAATGTSLWTTAVGGDVSSPVVGGGTVFVGTSDGDLVALNESTGAVLWTDSIGGSIDTAPALDTTSGLVVVTTSTGIVEAANTSTGKKAWSASIDGTATSAMIDSGSVYVASSTGDVVGLDLTSGTSEWSMTTGSAITAPPILADGRVLVGDAAGDLSYFSLTTGARTSFQTQFGKPITGLSCTGSVVLLSSSSGELAMIQGAHYLKINWTYKGTSGYASPGVLLNGDIFALGEDGVLRAFTTPGRSIA
jgi:outer membrane protein assembly factor BamB